jgi:hypothetical protein
MTRDGSLRLRSILPLACLILCAIQHSAETQRLPVTRGAIVRVLRSGAEQPSIWSTGRVVYASRDSLLLAETDGDPLVRFNESLRLQIERKRARTAVGGVVGIGIGTVVGWRATRSHDATAGRTIRTVAGTLVGGLAGAGIGALIGSSFHSSGWEDVPLDQESLAAAPLNEPGTQTEFSLSRTVRWTRFPPTVADFQAFFEAHADSLHPLEGIWTRHGTNNIGIAIVRVAGLDEEKYAAFTLKQYPGRPRTRGDGVLIFALSHGGGESGWFFQMTRVSPRRYRAYFEEGVLELEFPDGMVDLWEKLFPN